MLEAFITNLGRYNEGYLDGAYLKLPAEKEDVQALLKKIHVDGVRYEEIFITDYETDVPGLYDCLGEYESIDELNHLAHVLQEVEDQHDMDKFAAAVELGERTGSIKDLINLAQNLDCYYFYPDIKDEEDLGLYFVEELGALDIPDNLRAFFDFKPMGAALPWRAARLRTGAILKASSEALWRSIPAERTSRRNTAFSLTPSPRPSGKRCKRTGI